MRLRLKEKVLSLNPFDVEVPRLTILSGKNGSGKTHLLNSIYNRTTKAIVDGGAVNRMALFDQEKFSGLVDSSGRNNAYKSFQTLLNSYNKISEYILYIRSNYNTYENFLHNKKQIIRSIEYDNGALESFYVNSAKALCDNKKIFENGVTELELWLFLSKPVLSIPSEADILKAEVGLLYRAYDICVNYIKLNEQFKHASGNSDFNSEYIGDKVFDISLSEFLEAYGDPPWVRLAACMSEVGLKIASDPQDVISGVGLKFEGAGGSAVSVKHLSSGERALLALAIFLFQKENNVRLPSLILLDEADAFLHPTFCRKMLDVLQNIIKQNENLHIILATHSISTLSFSLEEHIFIMNYDKREIEKVSKSEALENLTEGVPYFKVFTEHDLTIICESPHDQQFYELLHESEFWAGDKHSKPKKINFVTLSGKTSREGVVDVVEMVRSKGIDTIYGIIDHDMNPLSKEGIIIAGCGERYTIENFLLDPLILASLSRAEGYGAAGLGVEAINDEMLGEVYLKNNPQEIVDLILQRIQPELDVDEEEKIAIETCGGIEYMLPKWFVCMDGHKLEEICVQKYKCLKSVKAAKDKISVQGLGARVVYQHKEFLSKKILESIYL